jgi:sigma-B regulation protein RsbU (phosphoserine phosphatase)
MASQGFISFFYAVVSPDRTRMTYCNAGHNPPLLGLPGQRPRELDCGGVVLGVICDCLYEEEELALRSGDRLLLYTDGITECHDRNDEEFGPDRLADIVERFHGHASALVETTIRTTREFCNATFGDDLTVLAVTVE